MAPANGNHTQYDYADGDAIAGRLIILIRGSTQIQYRHPLRLSTLPPPVPSSSTPSFTLNFEGTQYGIALKCS